MSTYLYTAWFRDDLAAEHDQDREWPACFVVDAPSAAEAGAWGDHLSRAYSRRRGSETFLRSQVELREAAGPEALPVIPVGYEATDGEIGW